VVAGVGAPGSTTGAGVVAGIGLACGIGASGIKADGIGSEDIGAGDGVRVAGTSLGLAPAGDSDGWRH
jgi:hypothetical protein